MDFGCQPASGTTETMISIPLFCRRALLVDANNRGVDHLHLAVMDFGDSVHEAVPHACFPPSDEAIVTGGAWTIPLW
jgi:hypothetical protein